MKTAFNMTTCYVVAFVLFATTLCRTHGEEKAKLPERVARQLAIIKPRLANPSNAMWVQLLHLPEGVNVDPPPSGRSFDRVARLGLMIRADYYAQTVQDAVSSVEAARWTARESEGYPRWCVRFLGANNELISEWLIDREGASIAVDEKWFYVPLTSLDKLTVELAKEAAKKLSE